MSAWLYLPVSVMQTGAYIRDVPPQAQQHHHRRRLSMAFFGSAYRGPCHGHDHGHDFFSVLLLHLRSHAIGGLGLLLLVLVLLSSFSVEPGQTDLI